MTFGEKTDTIQNMIKVTSPNLQGEPKPPVFPLLASAKNGSIWLLTKEGSGVCLVVNLTGQKIGEKADWLGLLSDFSILPAGVRITLENV